MEASFFPRIIGSLALFSSPTIICFILPRGVLYMSVSERRESNCPFIELCIFVLKAPGRIVVTLAPLFFNSRLKESP